MSNESLRLIQIGHSNNKWIINITKNAFNKINHILEEDRSKDSWIFFEFLEIWMFRIFL
ncbi:hypothetical protein P689_122111 [Candidatus Riesia pediculischaeffi PTSU]|uniref:Uncharacterized protein n=1 Tax=Candidatus Riesia pediculischaeffi PTSU TaxID=1401651 RepID=A0A0C1S054_9ENTR|nr:hypothetical protein P689_122111 [Candidatus Riesia pediculischaeffi PTSU]